MEPQAIGIIRASDCAAVVCALILSFAPARAQDPSPIRLGQGEVTLVPYQAETATEIRGRFYGRPIEFFSGALPGTWLALLGADLDDPPGPADLIVELGDRIVRLSVEVKAVDFGTQALTLPTRMVDLDAKTLARVNAEQARVSSVLAQTSPQRLWRGPFLLPTEGQIAGSFGMRRLLNGQPRNPHSGEDIVAPKGTPILAAQDGIVRLADDHFFSGKSIILDHGSGLFTLYFHLNESVVREGARVKRGEIIGKVGASGRVTGSHLHWGAVLAGARVNPLGLLSLPPE